MSFLRFGAAVLCAGLAGCGVLTHVPIVGSFVPDPAVENANRSQRSMIANMTVKPEWKSLCDAGKFKSALAYIDGHVDEIGETEAKQMTEDTHRQSRTYLTDRLLRFRRYLGDIKSQSELAAMKTDDFTVVFNLPHPDEMLSTSPAYEWARAHFASFEDFRSRKPTGESLLKAVADATSLPPDEDGENRWFEVIETLVFRAMNDAVRGEVERSQDAPKGERDESRTRAEALRGRWSELTKIVNDKNRPRVADHESQIARLLDGYPQDLKDLDAIDINACLSATEPEKELRKAERTLKGHEAKSGISRESRQRLYSMIVTVVALRNFLSGRDELDTVEELRPYGEKLKKVGGAVDARAFGARVQKVFDALLR